MSNLSNKLPDYFLGKYQLVATVTFTALFALVFMLLTSPISSDFWFELGATRAFEYTVLFCLLALGIIIASKVLMYKNRNAFTMTYFLYITWCVGELVLISTLYTVMSIEGDRYGIISIDGQTFPNLFFMTFALSLVAVGIPYVISGMYFAIVDKNNTIRLMNYGTVVTDETYTPQTENKINLFDNNGLMKLSVRASNLVYIESDDNYIKVWYLDSAGVLKQYMLRCRLKTVEESFEDSDLVRCHRKYIVNMMHVKMLSKQKDGYVLSLDLDGIDAIPVTKTYEQKVLARFNSR